MKKKKKTPIPKDVKEQIGKIIEDFNKNVLNSSNVYYVPRYRGCFLYLERPIFGRLEAICRLEYTENMDDWKFAIYKYSSNKYDSDAWMFPGDEEVDGTIEGAMRAGLKAYPA